jgi:hypothetical protein
MAGCAAHNEQLELGMKRILIGLVAVAVLAAGGWFGFNLYAKHRVTAEIETAFEQIRKQGGKASNGEIGFDLPSRTLTIEDIAVDPGQQSQMHIKIGNVRATGVRQGDDGQFSADTIEVSGIEFAIDSAVGPSQMKASYKIAQATIRDYSGAIRARALPPSNAITDLYRFGLEQISSLSAFGSGDEKSQARQGRGDQGGPAHLCVQDGAAGQARPADGRTVDPRDERFRCRRDARRVRSAKGE